MKKIWVAVLTFVLPLIFTLRVNAQAVSDNPSKAEIHKLFDTVPLEKMDKHGVPVKEPRFSASIGIGPGYHIGFENVGRIKAYDNAFSFSTRLGYSPLKYLEIQGEYSKTGIFKRHRPEYKQTISFTFYTFTVNLKAGIPVEVKGHKFYPYLVGGYGRAVLYYENVDTMSGVVSWVPKKYYTNYCSKIGFGIETQISDQIFLFSEVNNWKMLKWNPYYSVDRLDITYSQALVGATLKF